MTALEEIKQELEKDLTVGDVFRHKPRCRAAPASTFDLKEHLGYYQSDKPIRNGQANDYSNRGGSMLNVWLLTKRVLFKKQSAGKRRSQEDVLSAV
jgi:hypothetical protein